MCRHDDEKNNILLPPSHMLKINQYLMWDNIEHFSVNRHPNQYKISCDMSSIPRRADAPAISIFQLSGSFNYSKRSNAK